MREIARRGLGMARGTDTAGVFAGAHLDLAKGDEPGGVPGELRAGRAGVGVLHAPSRVHLGGRCGTLGRTRARRPCSRGREVEPPSRRARGDARRSRNAPKVARAGMATGSDRLPSPRRGGERVLRLALPKNYPRTLMRSTGVRERKTVTYSKDPKSNWRPSVSDDRLGRITVVAIFARLITPVAEKG